MRSKTKNISGGEMPLLSTSTKTKIVARFKKEGFSGKELNDLMKQFKYEYQGLSFLHHTPSFKPLNNGGKRKRTSRKRLKRRTNRKKYRKSIKKR